MAPYATPPVVSITSPSQDGLLCQGTVNITAAASPTGASGIEKVEFWLDDDALLATDTSSPYQTSLDTTSLADGVHTLEAIAFESGSVQNTGSAYRVCIVNNTHPTYATVGDALALDNGGKLTLQGKVVTAPFDGTFYIEETDRTSGIRVRSSETVYDGDVVTVVGTLGTVDGEREILADGVWVAP